MGNDRSSHADLGSLPKAQHDRDTELQPLGEFRYFLAEVSEPVLYVKIYFFSLKGAYNDDNKGMFVMFFRETNHLMQQSL